MRRLKLLFWWVLLAGALASVFIISFIPAQMRVYDAFGDYEDSRRMLEEASARREQMQQRLDELRTSVDSVELGARIEYRLIKPGERLEILEIRRAPGEYFAEAVHSRSE